MNGIEAVVGEFLQSSLENTQQLREGLKRLRECPKDLPQKKSILQPLDSLKNDLNRLAFPNLFNTVEDTEALIQRPLENGLPLEPVDLDIISEMINTIELILDSIRSQGCEPDLVFRPNFSELQSSPRNTKPTSKLKRVSPTVQPQVNDSPTAIAE